MTLSLRKNEPLHFDRHQTASFRGFQSVATPVYGSRDGRLPLTLNAAPKERSSPVTMICGWPHRFIDVLRNLNTALRSGAWSLSFQELHLCDRLPAKETTSRR